jgi:CPA2 family monovalent cation:H+ antiporter-2
MFRKVPGSLPKRIRVDLPDINLVGVMVEKDTGDFINKPIKEIQIRQKLGINIVAVKREGKTIYDITGDLKLKLGDLVYVVGGQDGIEKFQAEAEVN